MTIEKYGLAAQDAEKHHACGQDKPRPGEKAAPGDRRPSAGERSKAGCSAPPAGATVLQQPA